MTRAHVPPQTAGNRDKVTCGTVRVHNQIRSNGRPTAGGMWLRGLCGDCNSLAGLHYDTAYGDFTTALHTYARTSPRLHLPRPDPAPPVRLAPGRVARSILIGMFATTPHLRVMFPGLANDLRERRDHITMPDGATLRMALYPYRGTRLASMFNGIRVLKARQHYDVFSEVYFRPLAWALTPSGRWYDEDMGESVFDNPRWAVVDDWLQYGEDVTAADLRNLCRQGVPLIGHPLLGGDQDEWVQFFSDQVTAIFEGAIPA
ncbi:hypothetical protein [Streptomyces europaeiscabiei]|uniref:hypothetical protein n=1 Tax=Streptomyces europaeiscabiei TaxID=146819 RepID=UPI0029B0E240|nr:hypothetical protein [Streptomyces europaeiscabiei]MDX3587632.1 hypothetical protein [Streptomyces europaeiscabiei]